MFLHAYLTNGFIEWAEFFLETFKFHHGESIPVILTTRDLTYNQIESLHDIYGNLLIENEELPMKRLCKEANVSYKQMMKFKRETETHHVTMKNRVWKLLISADDRYKSVGDVMKRNQHEDFMLHYDIDMYFRDRLDGLFKIMKENDISLRFRLKSKLNRKILGSVLGFKVSSKSIAFMDQWAKHVDAIKPAERPLGYGQTSCYYAFKDMEDQCKWGYIPGKYANSTPDPNYIVWAANTNKGKTANLKFFRKDFERLKKKGR